MQVAYCIWRNNATARQAQTSETTSLAGAQNSEISILRCF